MASSERVLLLDCLDSTGSEFADVRERIAMLRVGGARVTALAIGTNLDPTAKGLGRGSMVAEAGPAGLQAARALAEAAHPDVAVVASAWPGGVSLARALPLSLPALWWPTGVAGIDRRTWLGRLTRSFGERTLPSVLASTGPSAGVVPSLSGCCFEPPASRRATLPLWDGEIVLLPEGLDEPGGPIAVAAFAALADEWSELDLVTWSHPRAVAETRAHEPGPGGRVHHVGPPPRMAEWAWWSQARAVVFTGGAALSGGMVLRALSAGCPLLFVGGSASFVTLARELMEQGCAWHVTPDARVVAAELSRLLDHGPEVAAAVERGRMLAARHDRSALAARVAAGLSLPPSAAAAA